VQVELYRENYKEDRRYTKPCGRGMTSGNEIFSEL